MKIVKVELVLSFSAEKNHNNNKRTLIAILKK